MKNLWTEKEIKKKTDKLYKIHNLSKGPHIRDVSDIIDFA